MTKSHLKLKPFQKSAIANAMHVKGLIIGDKAPEFTLPNATGKKITLSDYLKSGIVILKFYRGEWCPTCNLDLRAIQKCLPEIKSHGATVLAISPQRPDDALSIAQKNALEFEVLSDVDQEVIMAYNLQHDPGEEYQKVRDLSKLNGNGAKTLPVPATFIINQDQIIEAAHVEANYQIRMAPEEILKELRRISGILFNNENQ